MILTEDGRQPDAASRLPSPEALDDLLYRVVSLGFGLLAIVIMTGAMWAQHVYQSWWSWDPKETSALVAWLVYAAYLHGRLQRGWRGRRCAYLAIAGFFAVLFCFAGINLIPESYHTYGRPSIAPGQLGGWAGLPPLEAILTKAFLLIYVFSAIAHLALALFRAHWAGGIAVGAAWLGLACQTAAILARTSHAGRLPLSSGYEFSLCFVWGIVLCYLVLERVKGVRVVGVIALPIALLIAMYGYLWFPQKGAEPLPPALQNRFWLHVHVIFAIFAYGCLAVGAAVAGLYLLARRRGGAECEASGPGPDGAAPHSAPPNGKGTDATSRVPTRPPP